MPTLKYHAFDRDTFRDRYLFPIRRAGLPAPWPAPRLVGLDGEGDSIRHAEAALDLVQRRLNAVKAALDESGWDDPDRPRAA
jgi:hypothetical protein